MNIATYLRVSTSDQSVEAQRLELATWLRGRKFTEYSDIRSGARSDRPGLEALMVAVRAGYVQAVVCVKLDRMGRSLAHLARLVEEFEDRKVALVCTSQGIDTTEANACGKFQLAVLGAVAAFERELIRERTRAGLAVARAAGKVLGRPSAAMVGVDKAAVVAAWRAAGGVGGYRALGTLLGGVNGGTAWRVAAQYPATAPELVL